MQSAIKSKVMQIEHLLDSVSNLRGYYQKLIEQHQEAIAALQEQLIHVDALLEGHTPNKVNEDESDLNLCSKYQGLTLRGAIQKMLLEHPGEKCHVRFIANELIGRILTHQEYECVRKKINTALIGGLEYQYWFRDTQQPGYYYIDDMQSVIIEQGYRSQQLYSKKFRSDNSPLKPEYRRMSLIDAISQVFSQRPGAKLTSADIAQEVLPEHYSKQTRQEVQASIAKELSRGYQQGRFERVGNGMYTAIRATEVA